MSDNALQIPIPKEVASMYRNNLPCLLNAVDQQMKANPQIQAWIGDSFPLMQEEQRNHGLVVSEALELETFELLSETLPWRYRNDIANGFSADYFPAAFDAWIAAVRSQLPTQAATPLVQLYDWMKSRHEEHMRQAREPLDCISESLSPAGEQFLELILAGEVNGAMQMAESLVHNPQELEHFYLDVIQPVMYRVGALWEMGKVSVAREHLATSVANRIMANFYLQLAFENGQRGTALVASSPNEYHELGARMVADILEIHGWSTIFLGANTPADSLVSMMEETRPNFIALSTTLPFSLTTLKRTISLIRRKQPDIPIMVGGQIISRIPALVSVVGAHGCAASASDAVALAHQWH
ncbi:cobalamin B12-binding domain-containing protein [Thiorhodospira sibirica]|uniref:cobalamin B12-binding domain-containing protein n=1 Tax=Thiorhodospira sibirica TaxID=154347 RepID=UPI00022C58C1|nr:cobalamin-dependent protein [Thiorhodospira sibirica]